MHKTFAVGLLSAAALLGLAGCSETKSNPCRLVTVDDVRSFDSTAATSSWEKSEKNNTDNELCMFYTNDGDPRVMVFVWNATRVDLREMVIAGSDQGTAIVDLSDAGVRGAASFGDNKLQLLAVQSTQGTVGLRTRKPVRKGSDDFNRLVQLAQKAVGRIE